MKIEQMHLSLILTDGGIWFSHKWLISYFVKIVWNTKDILDESKLYGVHTDKIKYTDMVCLLPECREKL